MTTPLPPLPTEPLDPAFCECVSIIIGRCLTDLSRAKVTRDRALEEDAIARGLSGSGLMERSKLEAYSELAAGHIEKATQELLDLACNTVGVNAAVAAHLEQSLVKLIEGIASGIARSSHASSPAAAALRGRALARARGSIHLARNTHQLQAAQPAEPGDARSARPASGRELDDLVPLLRRKVFDTDLETRVADALTHERPLALVMIDLDHFKEVNDTYGHPAGDEVLVAVATVVAAVVSGKGDGYRYGGEELSLLLPNYSTQEAVALCERLRANIAALRFSVPGLTVAASFGVASLPEHAGSGEELRKLADAALYAAKKSGRNRVRAHAPSVAPCEESFAPATTGSEGGPAPEKHLSPEVREDLRRRYFTDRFITCPRDAARLEVQDITTMGMKTHALLVSCPVCGLRAELRASEEGTG